MILKDIYFFQNSSQTGDSAILSNESKGDTLSIQIDCSGSFTLSVQGCLDIESGIYQKVFATNMATNKRTDSLTQEGLYQVDVDGYRRIKLVLESIGGSPITAYGVMKEESGKIDVEDDVATKEYVEEYVDEAIAPKEDKTNKVTSLSSESTDTQYPSAKCVYDLFESLDITKREIVQELPTQDISTKTIYMVPKNPSGEDNYYTEYMYINNNWEKIGDTEIDLSGYQTLMQYSTVPTASVDVLGKIIQYTGTTTSNYTNGYYYMCISNGEATPTYFWERINVQPNQDLSGYVTFTDYATTSDAGVIKIAGETQLYTTSGGLLYTYPLTYEQYTSKSNYAMINKGTLENVIAGKNLETANNKVASLSNESTNIEYPSAKAVYDSLLNKQEIIQYSTMPEANAETLGKIVQFTGTTGAYTNGYYYICVSDGAPTPTYSWERKNVQPNQDLSGYVTFTDYATSSVAGVIKPSAGLLVNTSNGNAYCEERTYQQYQDGGSTAFISKGTLENVITGKNLVSNTDYASSQIGGVLKTDNVFGVGTSNSGNLYAQEVSYADYSDFSNYGFISKGTLENVIEGKELIDFSDLANGTTPGIVKTPSWSGISITDGDIFVKNHTYAQYLEANGAIAINKNTLEDVITGKNLETANNKVTSLSASSTDTQYPSAKAVYDTITDKISSVYRYKGSVADYAHLPSTDLTVGDVYNIEAADPTHEISAGDNVAWTGTVWDKLSGTVDLSGYQTKIDSSHKLSSDLVDDTGNTNLFVTSSEKSTWSGKQDALTAGDNITISGTTISATDTTYDDATTSASGLMSAADKTKLDGIATGAEVNVQANWNETNTDSDAYIQNKPTIPDELSDLTDDSTHRLVTDAEKSTWNGKQDVIQYSTMPVASAELEGKIVQYVGGSTLDYTNGYFYICESVGGEYITYKWTNIYVQEPPNLSNYLSKNNTTAYIPIGDYNPSTKKYVDDSASTVANNIAPVYSDQSTYAIGDYVLYDKVLYVCNTTISVAESWTAAHWTQTNIATILGNIETALAAI